jgi:hypothetical protein
VAAVPSGPNWTPPPTVPFKKKDYGENVLSGPKTFDFSLQHFIETYLAVNNVSNTRCSEMHMDVLVKCLILRFYRKFIHVDVFY